MRLNPKKNMVWAMSIPGVSGEATDALNGSIAGCDETLDLTATEAAAAMAFVTDVDDDVYQLSASGTGTDYAVNYQLFPGSPAATDDVAFAAAVPFCEVYFDVAIGAVYDSTGVIAWEYWNGAAWAALTIVYDHTGNAETDGTLPFQQDGSIIFIPPAAWSNAGIAPVGYWIRAVVQAGKGANMTTSPTTNSVEHKIVTPTDGFKCPESGTIVGLRLTNGNATAHTTADVKFFLMNFTTGAHSDELTFAQDKRNDRWDSTAFKTGGLAVNAGDILGMVITQPDGGAELTNVTLELDVNL